MLTKSTSHPNPLARVATPLETPWVRELQIGAATSAVIALGGLLALLSQGAWAQSPPPGLPSGNRAFSNPFAAQAPAPGSGFGEEDEDFGDEGFDGAGAPRAGANGAGGPANGGANGGASSGPSGVSVGGGPAGGVIAGSEVPFLKVDSESAVGSKEVVTDFNFPDADIMDIARALGKLTGKNFILDKDVKGRITVISNSPITVSDAWRAFLTALDMNGYSIIPSGKYIRIARQRDARDKQLSIYAGSKAPDTDALITRVFPLKYLSAEEVARNFRSFMPANARIIPYEQTNTVIVTDTGSNIDKLQKLLANLDVEGYDAGIETMPVKYASAAELAKLIDALLPGNRTNGAGARTGGRSTFSARRTKEGGVVNNIIADERTNILIVHANGRGFDQVKELVAKLDRRIPAGQAGGKVHVIYLQFGDSEAIAGTLNNISQGGAGTRPAGGGAGGAGASSGTNPVAQPLFEGNIRISPDKSTNALVVTASAADFLTIQKVVNRLDVPRDQVYAEIILMETTVGKQTEFSSNIASVKNGIGFLPNATALGNFLLNPISASGAVLGFKSGNEIELPGAPGTNQTVKVNSLNGLVTALQRNANGRVIATPQILALDNAESTFEQTDRIPFPVVTQVQGVGAQTGISKENVTLSIKIKPQINKLADFVRLEIEAKQGSFLPAARVPEALRQQAFATSERQVKSAIVVADKDTVVIGGLTRDEKSDQVAKVPLLGDIPVLGWLFRSTSQNVEKTNLLIFITPSIIRQYAGVREILDRKLRERDDFVESTSGGVDLAKDTRDSIIRSLPDLTKLRMPPSGSAVDMEGAPMPLSSEAMGKPDSAVEAAPAVGTPRPPGTPALGTPQAGFNQFAPPDGSQAPMVDLGADLAPPIE